MFKLGSNYIRFDKKINSSFFIKVYSQKSSVIKIEFQPKLTQKTSIQNPMQTTAML